MKVIEVTASNLDKYANCSYKACVAYKKSELNLPDKERKEWIFNKIWDLMHK